MATQNPNAKPEDAVPRDDASYVAPPDAPPPGINTRPLAAPYIPCPPPPIPPYPPPYCFVRGEWPLSYAALHWELIDPTAIRVFLRINCVDVDVAVLGSYQQMWNPKPHKVGNTTVTLELEAVVPTGLQLGMLRVKSMAVENTNMTEEKVAVSGVILQMWTPEGIPYPYPRTWPPSPPPGLVA